MDFIEKKPTLEQLVVLASEGFRQPITDVLIADVTNHLDDTDFCVCVQDGERLVACMLCKLPIPGVLYIAGTLVLPAYQGHGIKAEATRRVFHARADLRWFAGRTQSPIVWSSVHAIARQMLPHPSNHEIASEAHALRDQLARTLGMNGPIHHGFYGGALYGEKPINHDASVQTWWDSICNFERGDAVLYIARF